MQIPPYLELGRFDNDCMSILFSTYFSTHVRLIRKNPKKAADAASEAKSAFVANVSHEIRTPLNAIIGLSEILRTGGLSRRQRAYLDRIRSSSRVLPYLINDLLDFAKLEAGKLGLVEHPFLLSGVIAAMDDLFGLQFGNKGLLFRIVCDPDLPDRLSGDRQRIIQVLNNLLSNSLKFTENGAVKLRISLVAQSGERIQLRFAVEDSGIGIEDKDVSRLFGSFEQADCSATRETSGTGLGLSISRHFVEMMGGELHCSSTPGKGTTFSFELRLGCDPDGTKVGVNGFVGMSGMSGEDVAAERLERRLFLNKPGRALLVEDNETNRLVAGLLLEGMGFEVIDAENGAVGVQTASREDFDIIFMDLQMPVMDGYEATRQILEMGREVPVVALTAAAMAEDCERTRQAGMVDHLAKPIDLAALQELVSRYFSVSWVAERCGSEAVGVPAVTRGVTSSVDALPDTPAGIVPQMIPGIDLVDLGKRHRLTAERLGTILSSFVREGRRLVGQLGACSSGSAECAALVHQLKGSSGNVGASGLFELCLQLEESVAPQLRAELRDRLLAELAALLDDLQVYLTRSVDGVCAADMAAPPHATEAAAMRASGQDEDVLGIAKVAAPVTGMVKQALERTLENLNHARYVSRDDIRGIVEYAISRGETELAEQIEALHEEYRSESLRGLLRKLQKRWSAIL